VCVCVCVCVCVRLPQDTAKYSVHKSPFLTAELFLGVCERERPRKCVRLCVCVCVCACHGLLQSIVVGGRPFRLLRLCVCVREGERDRQHVCMLCVCHEIVVVDRSLSLLCVCVSECVYERERVGVCVCVSWATTNYSGCKPVSLTDAFMLECECEVCECVSV